MGGSDLDLSEVELADDEVTLTVLAVMGGSDVYLPEGMRFEVSQFAFMGANGVHVAPPGPGARGPLVRLRLISIMGGTDVKRGPKRSRRERRELEKRKRRRELDR